MGCDITLYCEGYVRGKWINIDQWYRTDGTAEYMVTKSNGFDYIDLIEGKRDYELFYLLAGVKNNEKSGYRPISSPKGLPPDMDQLIGEQYENWYDVVFTEEENINFHHASYLTLKELKESGYGDVMPLKGWVNKEEFDKHEEWMKDGQKYQLFFVDDTQSKMRYEEMIFKEWNGYLNLNLTNMISKMEQLKQEKNLQDDEEIRIVFWFDN